AVWGVNVASLRQLAAVTELGVAEPDPWNRAAMTPPYGPLPPATTRSPPGACARPMASTYPPEITDSPPSPNVGSRLPSAAKRATAIEAVVLVRSMVAATTALPSG